ncbi:hypothetical protein HPB49_008946 [Dermacentor silvarum]|uniref:Uncharacterized protein n=1 Tax=Dermacentor silvarum TaxID=543639 RepID=A0ACB8CE11_DERSI|nr:hypothetical protein HPB49_008946 [Dermacentor silvarum]
MTGRSNKTVNRIIQAYRKEGRIRDAPHKRHPRATTAAQDADILYVAKASPFSTAREIGAAAGVSASASTIKRRLAEVQNAECDCRTRGHDRLLRHGDRFICFPVQSLEFLLLNIISADAPSVPQQPVSIGSAAKHHRRSYRPE